MQNLFLPTSQLFYFICQLSRKGLISDLDRKWLKKLVIVEDARIFKILDHYHVNKSEDELMRNLQTLCKDSDVHSEQSVKRIPPEDYQVNQADTDQAADYIERNPQLPEELASPLGTQLFKRRLAQQARKK